jgi:hypothetical protein
MRNRSNEIKAGEAAHTAGIPGRAVGAGVVAALLWAGGVSAHCDPADGHFECPPVTDLPPPTDPVPGPGDKPVGNTLSRVALTGTGGTKIKAEVVSQRYSNNARQWYSLVDVSVRLPATALGIANKAQAQTKTLSLRYFHPGQDQPYAECALEPRSVSASTAIYSLGLKANAAHTLLRWGHCDDALTAGFDAVLPLSVANDRAVLLGPDGQSIAEFAPPLVVDVPQPSKPKKLPQPATARLLEGAAYKIKK